MISKDQSVIAYARRHQTKIAQTTMRMTPESARIMGGMNFSEAYKFIYDEDLRERLQYLVAAYKDSTTFVTELTKYGWETVAELRDLLKRIEPDYKE